MDNLTLPEEGINLPELLSAVEELYIDQALARVSGNVTQAAKLLGINRTTLREKLRRSGKAATVEPYVDPQGEFTFEKIEGEGYKILYKGEYVTERATIQGVNAFIKDKTDV